MQLSATLVSTVFTICSIVNTRFDDALNWSECFAVKDFVCLNHRCISNDLRCDGFNHCGDDSDEQTSCGDKGYSQSIDFFYLYNSFHFESRYFATRSHLVDDPHSEILLPKAQRIRWLWRHFIRLAGCHVRYYYYAHWSYRLLSEWHTYIRIGVVLFVASILALLYRMSSHSQLMRERQARLDFIRSQISMLTAKRNLILIRILTYWLNWRSQ